MGNQSNCGFVRWLALLFWLLPIGHRRDMGKSTTTKKPHTHFVDVETHSGSWLTERTSNCSSHDLNGFKFQRTYWTHQTLFKVFVLVSIHLNLRAASQWRYNGCTLRSWSLQDCNELLAGSARNRALMAAYLEIGKVCFSKCPGCSSLYSMELLLQERFPGT